jgi:hypothetical protein
MDGDTIRGPATLSGGMLDALMPMHALLDADGIVRSHGPTLARVFPGRPLVGRGLFDLFDLRSPRLADGPGRLAGMAGQKLRLVVRGDDAGLRLRGLLVPWPRDDATGRGGDARPCWIANLSFGIDLPRAVALLHLTDQDFAATDLAMELLYLAEANVSVTGELRALAVRLDGAHRQAREEAETDTLTGLRNRRAAGHDADAAVPRGCGFRADAHGSGLLQGGERHAGPCRGRPCPARGRFGHEGGQPGWRLPGPGGWRRIPVHHAGHDRNCDAAFDRRPDDRAVAGADPVAGAGMPDFGQHRLSGAAGPSSDRWAG